MSRSLLEEKYKYSSLRCQGERDSPDNNSTPSLQTHRHLHTTTQQPNNPINMSPQPSIAIIGAGLSGLALALSLHQQNIPSTLYETQPSPLDIGGAIMLSPNALRILDRLGVYSLLEPVSYKFSDSHFRAIDGSFADVFEFGNVDKYGYTGLRVYRYELIAVLLDLVRKADIPIYFGKKFSHVVSETPQGVNWLFADGSSASAALLVGADGIHSRVRQYLHPGLTSRFTYMVGVTAAVPTAQLGAEEADSYRAPVTLMHPQRDAFVIAPQLSDGSEVLIGKQYRFTDATEPTREEWKRLSSDKQWAVDFLRENHADFPAVVSNATSHIDASTVNIWPFYKLPKLSSWTSASQARVVIVGDAAHAMPPTAGQGVNQAFEDVYVLAGVLGRLGGAKGSSESGEQLRDPARVKKALGKWQGVREDRVDRVLEMNEQITQRRVPSGDKVELEPFELGWLYEADFDDMVKECLQE